MDVLVAVGLVAGPFLGLAVIDLVRFALRFWRNEIEMEPGGSFGKQLRRDEKS